MYRGDGDRTIDLPMPTKVWSMAVHAEARPCNCVFSEAQEVTDVRSGATLASAATKPGSSSWQNLG